MSQQGIVFPDDHKPHDTIMEWWYFNGTLEDESHNQYSFMDCLFRVDIERVGIPYLKHLPFKAILKDKQHVCFAHTVVSDIKNQVNYKEIQNISLISNDSFPGDRLYINYINPIIALGYVNSEIEQIGENDFHIKTSRLDLKLKSKRPALLEGGNGHISVCGRESYYYSLTDLDASGFLTIDGKKIAVTGSSWMDHQWADVSYKEDIWSWFSLKLDDGLDIMCCEYGDKNKKDYLVDVVSRSGKSSHHNDFVLIPGKDVWRSEHTKAEYPMSFDIEIKELEAKLHVKSLMCDQELIFLAINYWEGPIKVSGTIGSKEVKGVGFMELVGYPSDYNYLVSAGNEIKKRISDELSSRIHKKTSR